jgi:predicted DNA-binding protein
MQIIKSFRIPKELEEQLVNLAKVTNHSETFYVIQALKQYLASYQDYYTAMSRFNDKNDEFITDKKIQKELDL